MFSLLDWFQGGRRALESRMPQLEAEGIVLLDASVGSSATFRNFRAPGRYSSYERSWMKANLVLTKKRLLALGPIHPIINIPLTDARICQLRCSLERSGTLLIAFDANLFHPTWQGTIEYRFRTMQARLYLAKLAEI